jgi:hypothetical protein
MHQQGEGAIRQVLKSMQVSLAALFGGQREGSGTAAGVVFSPAVFWCGGGLPFTTPGTD